MAEPLTTFSVLEFEPGVAPIMVPAVVINWSDPDRANIEENLLSNTTFLSLLFQQEIPDIEEANPLLKVLRQLVSWRDAEQGERIQWRIAYEMFCEKEGGEPALFMHDLRALRDALS